MAENTAQIRGDNYQCTKEPPSVLEQVLAKMLKSIKSTPQSTLGYIYAHLKVLVYRTTRRSRAKALFPWPFCYLPCSSGIEALRAATLSIKKEGRKLEAHTSTSSPLEASESANLPQMLHALPTGATGALRQQRGSESLPFQGRRISS